MGRYGLWVMGTGVLWGDHPRREAEDVRRGPQPRAVGREVVCLGAAAGFFWWGQPASAFAFACAGGAGWVPLLLLLLLLLLLN